MPNPPVTITCPSCGRSFATTVRRRGIRCTCGVTTYVRSDGTTLDNPAPLPPPAPATASAAPQPAVPRPAAPAPTLAVQRAAEDAPEPAAGPAPAADTDRAPAPGSRPSWRQRLADRRARPDHDAAAPHGHRTVTPYPHLGY